MAYVMEIVHKSYLLKISTNTFSGLINNIEKKAVVNNLLPFFIHFFADYLAFLAAFRISRSL